MQHIVLCLAFKNVQFSGIRTIIIEFSMLMKKRSFENIQINDFRTYFIDFQY